jgi:ubiquinone/menaquinone biosynthesis C-methylase UbiE
VSFRDHFSPVAGAYARFRPRYPDTLFEMLAEQAPRRLRAWDCATGTGQAALGLAVHFERIVASDASAAQVAAATPHPRVVYTVARAEASGFADGSFDLLTVAQAVHWFDQASFYAEARRVLVPDGVLAVWCYGKAQVDREVDALLHRFHRETVGPFWPPERSLVDDEYRSLIFPFEEIHVPRLAIEQDLTLEGLGGYLRTWSSTQRFVAARGFDPVAPLLENLGRHWGPAATLRSVRWPVTVRAGRRGTSSRA